MIKRILRFTNLLNSGTDIIKVVIRLTVGILWWISYVAIIFVIKQFIENLDLEFTLIFIVLAIYLSIFIFFLHYYKEIEAAWGESKSWVKEQ